MTTSGNMAEAVDLEKLKLEDLRTILKKKGIVCTDKKKAELVKLVRKASSLYPDLEEDDQHASERLVSASDIHRCFQLQGIPQVYFRFVPLLQQLRVAAAE